MIPIMNTRYLDQRRPVGTASVRLAGLTIEHGGAAIMIMPKLTVTNYPRDVGESFGQQLFGDDRFLWLLRIYVGPKTKALKHLDATPAVPCFGNGQIPFGTFLVAFFDFDPCSRHQAAATRFRCRSGFDQNSIFDGYCP